MATQSASGSSSSIPAVEKQEQQWDEDLTRSRTVNGSPNDTSQPGLPTIHRRFANPAPLGLLSFATGVFLLSIFGLQTRGVKEPNVLIGVLIFFTGIGQYTSGIMEFIAGNTFGATVFTSYACFALSYAMIFIPGTGIMAAYEDDMAHFNQAISFYLFAWWILTTLFCVAAMRASLALMGALVIFDVEMLLLSVGYLLDNQSLIFAGNGVGFGAVFCAYWAACAGLWGGDTTPIRLSTIPLYHGA